MILFAGPYWVALFSHLLKQFTFTSDIIPIQELPSFFDYARPEKMTKTKKKRVRLSPEARRAQILDQTADMVAKEGVAQLTVERISKKMGISKSLVYAYFDSLTDLLRELYLREMRHMRRLQSDAATGAETFEGMVRAITHVYLKYIDERGLILDRLQSEPTVAEMHDPTEYNREAAVDLLADITTAHFGLPPHIARMATDISFGLPASAGHYLNRNDCDRDMLEDIVVSMITGTFINLQNDYLLHRKRLGEDRQTASQRKG